MNTPTLRRKVIEVLDGGELKLVYVLEEDAGRLLVMDVGRKSSKVSGSRAWIVHPEELTPDDFLRLSSAWDKKESEMASEMDGALLWQAVCQEPRPFTIMDLAAEYFGDAGPLEQSATLRVVLQDPVHFKLKGSEIVPRSEDEAAEHLHMLQQQEEKRLRKERVQNWCRSVLDSEETSGPSEEFEDTLEKLEGFLFRDQRHPEVHWCCELTTEEDKKAFVCEILDRCGRLPEGCDRFLAARGLDSRFRLAAIRRCEGLEPFEGSSTREDFSALEAFSIDDEGTEEIDDALTLEENGGNLRVGIHIADLTCFLDGTDELFEEALRRRTTIYLPHATIHMLPKRLSTGLASLRLRELRPCLSILATFTRDGELKGWEVKLAQVCTANRLSYREADQLIAEDGQGELGIRLRWLLKASDRLLEQRLENGGMVLPRPEIKVKVKDGQISVETIDQASASRRLVSEMMILANSLAAQYAFLKKVPMIFRVQPPPRNPVAVPEKYDPVALDQVFRQLEKSSFSVTRQPHAALGLPGYTQLTSPLRRLGDLVIQQQIVAHLSGDPLPFDQQGLLKVLNEAQSGEREAREIERQGSRFFLLCHLESEGPDKIREAVVVNKLHSGYLLETTDLCIRGKLKVSRALEPGTVVPVQIEKISPRDDILFFGLAGE